MKRDLYIAIYNALSDQVKRSETAESQVITDLCTALMSDRDYFTAELIKAHKALEYDKRMLEAFENEFQEPER